MSEPEELAYFRQALKDRAARYTMEGLLGSSSAYQEAIEMLQKCYNRPHRLYQVNIPAIVENPVLKEGNSKELRQLHDVISQRLRTLRVMSCEPSGLFITSMIGLKLDPTTAFEWQRHTQDEQDVQHFQSMLELLDVRAQATELITHEGMRRSAATMPTRSTTQV